MQRPELPPDVVVMPGTDVGGAWERFEVFEALHNRMRICNPMSPGDVDAVLAHLDLGPGMGLVDAGCGHGELLIRAAERSDLRGVGVDLSPWALLRARGEAERRGVGGRLSWWLGDAKRLPLERWDAAVCLGAPWIWNGFAGTAKGLAARTRPGGSMAIGDLALRPGSDPDSAPGRIPTLEDQERLLVAAGFEDPRPHLSGDDALDEYHARVEDSAREYARAHPGPAAERYLEEQRRWSEDHRRDRRILMWVVWTGRRAGEGESSGIRRHRRGADR